MYCFVLLLINQGRVLGQYLFWKLGSYENVSMMAGFAGKRFFWSRRILPNMREVHAR